MLPSMTKPAADFPMASLATITQTAVGCGIGMLIAGKLKRPAQKTTAIALLSIGLISTVPLVYRFFSQHWNCPDSDRAMRKRLASIREHSGFSDDTEIF